LDEGNATTGVECNSSRCTRAGVCFARHQLRGQALFWLDTPSTLSILWKIACIFKLLII